jgi:hypothetical protein
MLQRLRREPEMNNPAGWAGLGGDQVPDQPSGAISNPSQHKRRRAMATLALAQGVKYAVHAAGSTRLAVENQSRMDFAAQHSRGACVIDFARALNLAGYGSGMPVTPMLGRARRRPDHPISLHRKAYGSSNQLRWNDLAHCV